MAGVFGDPPGSRRYPAGFMVAIGWRGGNSAGRRRLFCTFATRTAFLPKDQLPFWREQTERWQAATYRFRWLAWIAASRRPSPLSSASERATANRHPKLFR